MLQSINRLQLKKPHKKIIYKEQSTSYGEHGRGKKAWNVSDGTAAHESGYERRNASDAGFERK